MSEVHKRARSAWQLLLVAMAVVAGSCATAVNAAVDTPDTRRLVSADADSPIERPPLPHPTFLAPEIPHPTLPAPAPLPTTTSTAPTTTAPSTTAPTTTTEPSTTSTTAPIPPAPQPGSVLHVATDGPADGDGSAAKPFPSLIRGLEAVGPGETLLVHGGEYRERISLSRELAIGRPDARVTVKAAPGERPVLRGRLRLVGLQYWTIDGLNVTWDRERNNDSEHMVNFIDGSNWVYNNAEVWDARSYAGVVVGGDPVDWVLRNLYIHDTHPTNDTNQDHLIYCNCGNGGGVIERNLLVGSANGRAIKLGTVSGNDSDVGNVTVRYNTMVDNTGPANIQLSYRARNITIERNLMVGPKPGRHNITTYQLAGAGSVARNNLGWDSVGVVEPHTGLADGGGNVFIDPVFAGDYRPTNPSAVGYGHLAPE